MQPNPNWLNDEIRRGLSRLVCLCLDSAPAVDLVEGTAQAWLTALTRGRAWDEQRDAPSVRAAFHTSLATAHRWPLPRDLLASMSDAHQPAPNPHQGRTHHSPSAQSPTLHTPSTTEPRSTAQPM